MNEQLYKCPNCGWIGTEAEMTGDSIAPSEDEDELWTNWACPQCLVWHQLEDYEKVSGEA